MEREKRRASGDAGNVLFLDLRVDIHFIIHEDVYACFCAFLYMLYFTVKRYFNSFSELAIYANVLISFDQQGTINGQISELILEERRKISCLRNRNC